MLALPLLLLACAGRPDTGDTAPEPDDTTPTVDTATWCVPTEDLDGVGKDWDCDGYASDGYVGGTDCDDADPAIHPGVEELCNGVDDDCDGAPEDPDSYVVWYPDDDGDGYGRTADAVTACVEVPGSVTNGGDCDDADPASFPGAEERCDGIDGDCDGWVHDEDDADADGQRVCDGDCDDGDASVYTGAPEDCSTRDLDCDGVPGTTDADGDGFVGCAGDCDDGDASVHPGATETCDGADTDCDGSFAADDVDDDGDGWAVCAGDCDDADADAHPGALETCDGVDDDCDGTVDLDCFDCDLVVPDDYATIQSAIDAATAGDVVCVGPGTWTENLDYHGSDITVVGVAGADATVIDGSAYDAVVRFASGESAAAVLRGFTLTNGYPWDGGGGIHVDGASPTFEDLRVTANLGSWQAGGIYVYDGSPTFARVEVTDNVAYAWYCAASYGDGGGLYASGADLVLDDVTFAGNYAGESGGGIYLAHSTATLTNVTVSGNHAELSGAGILLYTTDAILTNVRVTDNDTGTYWGLGSSPNGGGLALWSSDPTLTNVAITGNFDDFGAGAIYGYDSDPTLVNVVIADNSSGIYVHTGAPSLAWSDVWDNGGADFTGMPDPTGTDGNVSVDPVLLSGGQLDVTSPLVDAGDPSLPDPDGSPSDIGAFGGAGASSWDADLDGWPAWWLPGPWDSATSPDTDCDDDDATVYPGAGC